MNIFLSQQASLNPIANTVILPFLSYEHVFFSESMETHTAPLLHCSFSTIKQLFSWYLSIETLSGQLLYRNTQNDRLKVHSQYIYFNSSWLLVELISKIDLDETHYWKCFLLLMQIVSSLGLLTIGCVKFHLGIGMNYKESLFFFK